MWFFYIPGFRTTRELCGVVGKYGEWGPRRLGHFQVVIDKTIEALDQLPF